MNKVVLYLLSCIYGKPIIFSFSLFISLTCLFLYLLIDFFSYPKALVSTFTDWSVCLCRWLLRVTGRHVTGEIDKTRMCARACVPTHAPHRK